MSTLTLENFFTGKTFVIPSYQRDYAWTERNVDDLFGDVEEAIEVGGNHYLGTFILSQADRSAPVCVVDGQQRLTTLTMLMDALIDVVEDEGIKQYYRNTFIHHPVTGAKFRVLGSNEAFFRDLLDDKYPTPESDGQERMRKAYDRIRLRVKALLDKGGQDYIKEWLFCVSNMEVLQFVEPNEGKAIRMFQSVNDRGVPLAKMDIVKSLLVYHSNRYLQGELDAFISEQFGRAFRSFSRIKRLAAEEGYKIRQIDRKDFGEDDVLRYHYLSFSGDSFGVVVGNFWATSEEVLQSFLKPALQKLRAEPDRLKAFISFYVLDLAKFFSAFEELIAATRTDKQAYLLWVIQDLSTTLYPLVIRLHLNGWLGQVGNGDPRTLMEIVEMTDLRVFKIRGTNPQAEIFRITRDLHHHNVDWVLQQLQAFCAWGMPDAMMVSRLSDEDVYRNPAVQRMLLEEEVKVRASLNVPGLDLSEIKNLVGNGLTVEHILPQDSGNSFNPMAYGFATSEEYMQYVHRLGNLVLLESGINSACKNHAVEAKMSRPNLYLASSLRAVKAVAAQFAGNAPFGKSALLNRSKKLAEMMVERWPIRYQ